MLKIFKILNDVTCTFSSINCLGMQLFLIECIRIFFFLTRK
uniref:Uncharacterized protein n=1 Tax=Rhizophora mucronata TaxID=61149 RepID=A0A2P2NIX8_RHIMU